ncbi:HK97 family phage prohead protease [Muricoccus radiodurans]|uniref:HK97 family phage prohead protease n=1 Tax=Muricoccus radiodurans TaxID=2231721 RepID=UPI003CED7CE7
MTSVAATRVERRAAVPELRAAEGRRLIGHAAIWDAPARIGGAFTEVIRRGAFAACLARSPDVRALQDHDDTRLLGRTKAGTLELHEDDRGLAFTVLLPNTTVAGDLLELVQRGDASGCSFGFIAIREGWPARDHRELLAVDLVEISICCAPPAYPQTSVQARSLTKPGGVLVRQRFVATL